MKPLEEMVAVAAFDALCHEVSECRVCPRMAASERVLSRGSGPVSSSAMFIGEAPGRLGADESGIPFHGDIAGRNFESLLESAELHRKDIFVTNAVLCNPKGSDGNNATPLDVELANCGHFLRRQIEIVNPRIVVTLGATALRAVAAIAPHNLSLQSHVRTATRWFDRILIPLYHPGQRAMMHRSFANQRADYWFVAEQMARLGKKARRSGTRKEKQSVSMAVHYFLSHLPGISYFALHKLLFFAEVEFRKKFGHGLTTGFFIRQKNGPYCVDLDVRRLKISFPSLIITSAGHLSLANDLFAASREPVSLSHDVVEVLREVAERYGRLSDFDLKRRAYLTAPMKALLREEHEIGRSLFNAPLFPAEPKSP